MGGIQEHKNKTERTCSTIQRQHIRTSHRFSTLLFVRIASATARAPSAPILLRSCEIMRMRGRKGEIQQNKNKTERTRNIVQLQHIRTRSSFCTLLLVRIASAIARAPSAPMSFNLCKIMEMRGRDGGNSTKQGKK
jgi:hypothetical protein